MYASDEIKKKKISPGPRAIDMCETQIAREIDEANKGGVNSD